MSSPKRRIPRSTLVPLLLLVYLAVMSYIGWGNYAKGETSALYYFGTIGVTMVIILLLHFNLKRRRPSDRNASTTWPPRAMSAQPKGLGATHRPDGGRATRNDTPMPYR